MTRFKRMQFWGEDENDDSLIREVLEGKKTATVCKADEYDLPEGDYDDGGWETGDLVEVYDNHQKLRCLIEITEVYRTTFGNFPDKLWMGEVCRDAEHFREAHRHCWPEYDLTDDFDMMATHFRLVKIIDSPDTPS